MKTDYSLAIGFKRQTEWEGAMFLEMAFGGLGGGLFIVSAINNFLWGVIAGFVILVVLKGIFIMADLGKPMRMLNVFKRPFQSWISFGGLCFALFAICGFLYCGMLLFGFAAGAAPVFKFLAIALALVEIVYDGLWLFTSTGISGWGSSVLAPLFGLNAIAGGIGLYQVIGYFFQVDPRLMAPVLSAVLVGELVCLFTYGASLLKGNVGAQKSYEILVKGELKAEFIFGVGICGVIVPLAINLLAAYGSFSSPALLGIVGVLGALSVFMLRDSILKCGVYTPVY